MVELFQFLNMPQVVSARGNFFLRKWLDHTFYVYDLWKWSFIKAIFGFLEFWNLTFWPNLKDSRIIFLRIRFIKNKIVLLHCPIVHFSEKCLLNFQMLFTWWGESHRSTEQTKLTFWAKRFVFTKKNVIF